MKTNLRKALVITVCTIAMLMSACTKTVSAGGHSVTVTMPHNSCNIVACTSEQTTTILSVK